MVGDPRVSRRHRRHGALCHVRHKSTSSFRRGKAYVHGLVRERYFLYANSGEKNGAVQQHGGNNRDRGRAEGGEEKEEEVAMEQLIDVHVMANPPRGSIAGPSEADSIFRRSEKIIIKTSARGTTSRKLSNWEAGDCSARDCGGLSD